MIVKQKGNRDNFVMADKQILDDNRLSVKARFILIYYLGKPDNWAPNINHMAKVMCCGTSTVRRCLNELIEYGYVYRISGRAQNGRYGRDKWFVFEHPSLAENFDFTSAQNTDTVKTVSVKCSLEEVEAKSAPALEPQGFKGDSTSDQNRHTVNGKHNNNIYNNINNKTHTVALERNECVEHENSSAEDELKPAAKAKTKPVAKTANRFDEFWDVYPKGRKAAKPKCLAIWKRKNLDAKADDLIADVKHRITSHAKWLRGYTESTQTYLNQERWTDDIEPIKAGSNYGQYSQSSRVHKTATEILAERHAMRYAETQQARHAEGGALVL